MSVSVGFNPPIGIVVTNILSDIGIYSFLVIVIGN
jgi:hypothetical protein